MARNLKTGWVVLATSGSVVDGAEDGRFVKKEWLEDMAETYNSKVFTAVLWPDHHRYTSGGTVLALKIEPATEPELSGEIQLFGILSPADWLVTANKEGHFTFPSIEVGENHLGNGKFFLKGLGVLDEPASAGVTELKFSHKGKTEIAHVVNGHQFNLSEKLQKDDGLLKRVFGNRNSSSTKTNVGSDDMNEEQLKELFASFKTEILADVETKFSALKTAMEESSDSADTDETEENDDSPESKFAALSATNQELKTKFEALETQFKTLTNAPAGDSTIAPEGGESDADKQVI